MVHCIHSINLLSNGHANCTHSNVIHFGNGVPLSVCDKCHYKNKPNYNIQESACSYLGKRVRNVDNSIKQIQCTTGCAKGTMLDVFNCKMHGECTLADCAVKGCFVSKVKANIQNKVKFERSFLINLSFKTDRLESFKKEYPSCLPKFELIPAVHGDSIRHPDWWLSGAGAWGCYRSHLRILEDCYMQDVESYLVFEDDAIFRPDFAERFNEFVTHLPSDWQQIYLGGQLLHEVVHPPKQVNSYVWTPYNVNRTHCYAVHRRGYETLYKHLYAKMSDRDHIDHHLGRLHETGELKIYCPGKWLVGQDAGRSNISGNHNNATFWPNPESILRRTYQDVPAIYLEASIDVAIGLERLGWHRGYWQTPDKLDNGIHNALGSSNITEGLRLWYSSVMPEAVRDGKSCICLYHPALTWSMIQALDFGKFHKIIAKSIVDAERQFSELTNSLIKTVKPKIKKNAIFHIWPKKGNGVWQWNVQQFLQRIEGFDGARSVAIVTSDDADVPEVVQAAFEGHRIDNWLILPNNPELSEIVTFQKLLETLPKDDSITFRGHAKGVKYDNPNQVRDWTEMMYEICLDDFEYVEASLDQWPATGPFLCMRNWPPEIGGPDRGWYYSGAFYWFRNSILEDKSITTIKQHRWGAELWLASLFHSYEVGCLFGQNVGFMYNVSEVIRMKGLMDQWQQRKRRKTPSISIVLSTLGRSSLTTVLRRLNPQLSNDDEIIIVADGSEAQRLTNIQLKFLESTRQISLVKHSNHLSKYGQAQKNYGKKLATKDLVWFVDDDDIPSETALTTIRREMATNSTPTLFKIIHYGSIIWKEEQIREGNVAGQMLVIPNDSNIPDWPMPSKVDHLDDFEWIEKVAEKYPIRWSPHVIYELKQHSWGVLSLVP